MSTRKDITTLLKLLNKTIVPNQSINTKLSLTLKHVKGFFDFQELHLVVHDPRSPIDGLHIPHDSPHKELVIELLPKSMTQYEIRSLPIQNLTADYMSLGSFGTLVALTDLPMSDTLTNQFKQTIIFLDQFFYSLKQQEQTYSKVTRYFEERQFFRKVIDTIPDMIAVKNDEDRYILINEAARIFYKPRMGDLEGKTIDEVYPADQAKLVRALDAEALEARTTVRKRFKMHQNTESEGSWVESIRTPIYDNNQEMLGLISVSRDINEVEIERAINERNHRFQRVLLDLASRYINIHVDEQEDSINEILKKSGEFIDADRTYVFLYHFDRNLIEYKYEWCKEGIEPQIDNEQVQFVNVADFVDGWVDKHLKGEPVYIPDVDALDRDSMAYQTLSIQDIQSLIAIPLMAQNRCLGFVGFDDVRQKRAWNESEFALLEVLAQIITNILIKIEQEKALIESKLDAEKANEAKSTFLANVSHEIRTPIAAMSNALYLIDEYAVNSHAKEMVKVLNISLNNMSQLISNILDITKIESQEMDVNPEWFDLETLICNSLKTQKPFADQQGIEMIFDYDYDIPALIFGDRMKVQQVLTNLLNNALKFTLEGTVTLSATLKGKTKKHAKIQLAVTDTGVGIKEEHVGRLIEKFYRVQEASTQTQSGTGLGLPIVDQLIKALGGSLKIESEYQKGSVFSTALTFPYDTHMPLFDVSNALSGPIYVVSNQRSFTSKIEGFMTYLNADTHYIDITEFLALPSDRHFMAVVVLYEEAMKVYHAELLEKFTSIQSFKMLYTDTIFPSKEFKLLESQSDLVVDFCASRATILEHLQLYFTRSMKQSPNIQPPTPAQHRRILVVEDNPLNRQTITMILQNKGYQVEAVESGEEALQKAQHAAYHTVVMDIQLPGIDGLETMKRLKKLWGPNDQTPFIATTAHAAKENLTQYYDEGFKDVMTKPMNIPTLLNFLDQNGSVSLEQIPDVTPAQAIDYEALVQRFDDQEDIAQRMIHMFLQQVAQDLQDFDKTLEANDVSLLKKKLHTFKGSLDYLGASNLSKEINTVIHEADTVSHDHLTTQLYNLKEAIITWCDLLQSVAKEKDGK